MDATTERLEILDQIERGQLSAAEGIRRLEALSAAEPVTAATALPAPDLAYWRRWWRLPFGLGLALAAAGGALGYWALRAAEYRLSMGWLLAVLIFSGGALLAVLAVASRGARWLHIRLQPGPGGRRLALSFPLPLGLTAWALRAGGRYVPQLRHTGVDELILALGDATSPANPLYVEVAEGAGGEQVQVYLG